MKKIIYSFLFFAGISFISSCSKNTGNGCGTPSGSTATSITPTSATFHWNSVSGAISYLVQYRKVGATVWMPNTVTADSLPVTGLADSTIYEWQVQTICSSGLSGFTSSNILHTRHATASYGAWTVNGTTYVADSANFDVSHNNIRMIKGNVSSGTGLGLSFNFTPYPTTSGTYSTGANAGQNNVFIYYQAASSSYFSSNTTTVYVTVSPANKISFTIPTLVLNNASSGGAAITLSNVILNQ
jgi:hypothetical protein